MIPIPAFNASSEKTETWHLRGRTTDGALLWVDASGTEHEIDSGASSAPFAIDGTGEDYAIKGLNSFDAYGYLGVQGTADFNGITTLDIAGDEIGVLGASTGGSSADNYGVYGHSNGWGGHFEHDSSGHSASLGGGSWAASIDGPLQVSTSGGTSLLETTDSGQLEVRINPSGADVDFVVEDSSGANSIFHEASTGETTFAGHVGIMEAPHATARLVVSDQIATQPEAIVHFQNDGAGSSQETLSLEYQVVSNPTTSQDFITCYDRDGRIGRLSGDGSGGIDLADISDAEIKSEIRSADTADLHRRAMALPVRCFRRRGGPPTTGYVAQEVAKHWPIASGTVEHKREANRRRIVEGEREVLREVPAMGVRAGAAPVYEAHREAVRRCYHPDEGDRDAVCADLRPGWTERQVRLGDPEYHLLGVDPRKLVPLLHATCQEQQRQIDAQEAAIAALTARLDALEAGAS